MIDVKYVEFNSVEHTVLTSTKTQGGSGWVTWEIFTLPDGAKIAKMMWTKF